MLTPISHDSGVDRSACAPRAVAARARRRRRAVQTTGEGDRFRWPSAGWIAALLAAGVPAERVVAATAAALTETIALTRESVQSRCAACLVLPPFFFKACPTKDCSPGTRA
jgi:4-hydroxy-tetrahydrodipicolinate synthase